MSHGENPYAAGTVASVATSPAPAMDYVGCYGYVFQSPAWLPNLFFVLLCQLIPVVGPIVVLGYQFEIVEALLRDPRRIYPDFDWGKFVPYLTRGVWPFLIALIVAAVIAPVAVIGWFGLLLVGGAMANAGGDAGAVVSMLTLGVGFVLSLVLMIAVQFVACAFQLRAGLSQDFGASFNLTWVRDFISRVWLEMVLGGLFLALSASVLFVLGIFVFCIGMYLAMAWTMLAQARLYFQWYRLYLSRGGEPIPLKPQPVPAMVQPQGLL